MTWILNCAARATKRHIRTRSPACATAIFAVAILTSSPTQATFLNSMFFDHQYNGDVYPVPAYTENAGESPDYSASSDGDSLVFYNGPDTAFSSGYFESNEWTGGPNPVSNSTGWTIEFRVKIDTDAPDDPTTGAFQVFAKDLPGKNSQGRRAVVQVGSGFTNVRSGVLADSNSNTDDFHVFRIAQPASSNQITVWRDGVQIFSGSSSSSNDSSSVPAQMWWGDGSSGLGGPTVYVDYFRWDSNGFSEAPEPASLTLCALGLVAIAGHAARRRMAKHGATKRTGA
ncbi:MAG: hypothetical protein HYX69_12605 [Planctomycetia bacterium]|nr:hypothetical protein [Planctomycetia bacterium]